MTFQGQKEKMVVLSSGHLSLARKTSWNVRRTLSTTAATPNTECWGVRAPGLFLSIDTLTLTRKVTVLGQGHENVEISRAFFSANSCWTCAQFWSLVRVRDLRRLVQLQRRVLTLSNRGWGWRNGGCKTVDQFSQSRWYVACLLNVFKIYRWFV